MAGLLDVADVITGNGHWMSGYEVDALACGRTFDAVDICVPGDPPDIDDSLTGYKITPFAIVSQQRFGARCTPAEAWSALDSATDDASENIVAKVFWNGDGEVTGWDSDMFMTHADIETSSAGSSNVESLATAWTAIVNDHPDLTDPVLHLGVEAAMDLDTKIKNLDIDDVVVSPAYPQDAIAITGPIVVRLSDIQSLTSHDRGINRRYFEATRLAAIEFDPCLAVRVG